MTKKLLLYVAILFFTSSYMFAQRTTVTGTVSDESGPLPGDHQMVD